MEVKDDEFQTLRIRVDHISSELDKQNTVRAVNTKWMIIVGTVILAALGFTSFVQLPREAARAAREQVGPEIMDEANRILSDLRRTAADAKGFKEELGEITELQKIANLSIGTIIPSMLDPNLFAQIVGDPPAFDPEKSKWVLADGQSIVKNSRYGQLSNKAKTPDLRGMFLRGINDGRNPGDYQADALQQHGHKTTAKGLKWGSPAEVPTAQNLGYTTTGNAHAPDAQVTIVKDANVANETRPKNVAVYFYIKIN